MDDRLFKFANMYELETLAFTGRLAPASRPVFRAPRPVHTPVHTPVPVPAAVAPAVHVPVAPAVAPAVAPVPTTPSGLMGQVSSVGRGARDARQAVTSGVASVGRGIVRRVRSALPGAPRIDARIRQLLDQHEVVATKGANGKVTYQGKPGWQNAVGDDIIAVKTAAKQRMFSREITRKFQGIERKISAWEKAANRSSNRFYDNFTSAMASGGIRELIANARLPRMKHAIIVSTALTVLYYLFSGKAPQAQTPEMKALIENVQNPGMPIIIEILKRIEVVVPAATSAGKTQAAAELNSLKTVMSNVQDAQLNLDNPGSGHAFTQLIRSAETVINSVLPQLQDLEGTLKGEDLKAIEELQGALGEFLLEVSHVRGAIS